MIVKEFVGYFRMAKDKKVECEKRVKKNYIPILTKIAECSHLVDITSRIKDETTGIESFQLNTPGRYIAFTMKLISLYTDIEIGNGLELYENFDELNENGAIDILLSCIPEHEYKEFSTLLSMTVDDYMANERDLTAYLDRKMNDLMMTSLLNAKAEEGETDG